jgi:hypothetical protein
MSITLTTPTVVTASGLLAANVTAENDPTGGVSRFMVDFLAGTVIFELVIGQLVNGNINVGVYPPKISVTVNLATGAWTATSGQSGTIPVANLAGIISQFAGDRNIMEQFSAGNGILPGAQVAWSSTSI